MRAATWMNGRERVRRSAAPPGAGRGEREWPAGSLLGMLAPPARDRLLRLGSAVQYAGPSRILIREGDHSTFVVVILDGVVKVTGYVPGGRDVLLAIRMAGDAVGEFAALDERPRSATVITCGAVVGRIIKAGDFLDCLRHDPDISRAVQQSIVAKLRSANTHRVDFSGCDVPTRLARVLYEIAMSYGIRSGSRSVIRWPLTQPELASLAASAEPTVHRVLRDLRESGVVSTGYRAITILDLDRLHAMAYPDGGSAPHNRG
jgi:CRP/FNR family transcriptional regulator, cyclic AMP receptor protein